MGWRTTAEAPAAAWPWQRELDDPLWEPPDIPPDEEAACREVHRIIRARDGHGIAGKIVVDLGCGRGVCLREAARLGAEVLVGIDPEPGAIELCAKVLAPYRAGKKLRAAPGWDTGLGARSAEVVWSHGVVEHLRPDELHRYLLEAARISSGWVAVSAPNPQNLGYQCFRTLLLDQERWPFGYEEPLPWYGDAFRAAHIEVVDQRSVGDGNPWLTTLYARQLPERGRDAIMDECTRGPGPVTLTVGRVHPLG
jgi:SAM-dependent methyltransferase